MTIQIDPRIKSDILKVMVITICYVMINLFFSFYNDSLITSGYVLGTTEKYDGSSVWLLNALTGVLAGVLGGTALVKVNGSYFRRKSFNQP